MSAFDTTPYVYTVCSSRVYGFMGCTCNKKYDSILLLHIMLFYCNKLPYKHNNKIGGIDERSNFVSYCHGIF